MSSEILKIQQPTPIDVARSKRDKFVELAQKRTINAIKAIRVIAKLGNKSAYDYTDADVLRIVKALTDEIEALKSRMKSSSRPDSVDFSL